MTDTFRPIGAIAKDLMAEIGQRAIAYQEAKGNHSEADDIRRRLSAAVAEPPSNVHQFPLTLNDALRLQRQAQQDWLDNPCRETATGPIAASLAMNL